MKSPNWDEDATVLEVRDGDVDLGDLEVEPRIITSAVSHNNEMIDFDTAVVDGIPDEMGGDVTTRTPRPMRIPMASPHRISSPSIPRSVPGPTPRAPITTPDQAAVEARLATLSLAGQRQGANFSRASASKLPWVLLVAVVAGFGIYHFAGDRESAAPQGAQNNAPNPTPNAPSGSLLASGYVAAKVPIVISATSSGRIQEVRVDNGDMIRKGQVLAVIDDAQIRAELGLASARVRDAQRQYSRVRMLADAQAATPQDRDRAMGAVEVAGAEWRVIQQKLEDTRIKSPINGTVLEVIAHAGETMTIGPNSGGAILRVADLSALNAEVDVAEAELKNVRIGQEAEVMREAQRGKPHRGIVREIAQQADRARGTVLVKVEILGLLEEANAAQGGAGSAASPATPAPKAAPAPAPKSPRAMVHEERKSTSARAPTPASRPNSATTPKIKAAGSAAAPSPAPAAGSGSAAGSAAPGAVPDEDLLKPGMAIQVRFLAPSTTTSPAPR